MKAPTWINKPGASSRRWRAFLDGAWEPSEWMDATPLLFRPYGVMEGAHLYRFGNAMPKTWDPPAPEGAVFLQKLWQEYPCFFLPRTLITAWLIGHRADPGVLALIREIVAWPEAQNVTGTALQTLQAMVPELADSAKEDG